VVGDGDFQVHVASCSSNGELLSDTSQLLPHDLDSGLDNDIRFESVDLTSKLQREVAS
jgi:hypothetical protein